MFFNSISYYKSLDGIFDFLLSFIVVYRENVKLFEIYIDFLRARQRGEQKRQRKRGTEEPELRRAEKSSLLEALTEKDSTKSPDFGSDAKINKTETRSGLLEDSRRIDNTHNDSEALLSLFRPLLPDCQTAVSLALDD